MSRGRGAPGLPLWAGGLGKQMVLINAAFERSFGMAPEHRREIHEALRELARYAEQLRPVLQRTTERLWHATAPENWDDLQREALELTNLIERSGICLIWAPRPEVIREVLAAKESARLSTLAGSTDAVLDDLDAVLAQAQNLDLDIAGHPDACAFAAEGIAAARDGHFNAAQSLAACGLGPILHETWGFRLLGEAFKEFRAQSVDDVGMQLMKLTLLQSCTATALIDTEDANPNGFNRHATQHGNREFFSRANALAGVLLLVGWLREFKWLADNHPRLFRADNDGDNDAQGESGQERK